MKAIDSATVVSQSRTSMETRSFVTSLGATPADAQGLFTLIRGHGSVENKNHRRRDAIGGEDRCLWRNANAGCSRAL